MAAINNMTAKIVMMVSGDEFLWVFSSHSLSFLRKKHNEAKAGLIVVW